MIFLRHWLLVLAAALPACAQSASAPAECSAPLAQPISYISVSGRPFGIAVTKDGCSIFVAVMGDVLGSGSGVALLSRSNGKVKVDKFFPIEGRATDIVLTHDEQLLIVAGGLDVAFMNAQHMLANKGEAVAGYLRELNTLGSINVNVTRDDKFLFVSDEGSEDVRVIDLDKARKENFSLSATIGRIPVGIAPIALVFSPDEKLLYNTVELMPRNFGWKDECQMEGEGPGGKATFSAGAVVVIDVDKAKTDPQHSILKWLAAGCSPVRAVLSPTGDFLYVTARSNNAVEVFETAKMLGDPAHSMMATVPVGKAPVGIAVADGGKKIFVANSNRFAGSSGGNETLTVIDATKVKSGAAAVLGTLPAQSFPRELASSPDGRTIYLSNFNSNSVEVIDVERMPVKK